MYLDRFRLRVFKGVLPYIVVVDDVSLLPQNHQGTGTKNIKLSTKQPKQFTSKQWK